jgi:hypothetical protein
MQLSKHSVDLGNFFMGGKTPAVNKSRENISWNPSFRVKGKSPIILKTS